MFSKIELIYIACAAIIPILYLIRFAAYKSRKKKNYGRALLVALVIFLITIFIGFAVKLCFFNDSNKKENDVTTTTIIKTTEATTTTTTVTTTKRTTQATSFNYDKILAPTGGEVIGTTSKGYEIRVVDGLYYIGGYLIANKTNPHVPAIASPIPIAFPLNFFEVSAAAATVSSTVSKFSKFSAIFVSSYF